MFSSIFSGLILRSSFSKPPPTFQWRHPSLLIRLLCNDASSSLSPVRTREPPPIRVSLTSSAGRGVFATRNIAMGEVIHTAEPVVSHPYPSLIDKVCYYCLRRLGSGCCEESNCSVENDGGRGVRFCGERCKDQSKESKVIQQCPPAEDLFSRPTGSNTGSMYGGTSLLSETWPS